MTIYAFIGGLVVHTSLSPESISEPEIRAAIYALADGMTPKALL